MIKLSNLFMILIFIIVTASVLGGCESTVVRSEGIINLWDTGPITMDPAISGELASHNYIMQIFSGLVYLDDELNVKPDIAESWQKSVDGKTYTFKLRRNVKFHDGRDLFANDVKYSWDRACNPKTGSDTAAMYLNDIVGSNDVIKGKATEIRGVQIVDPYTLKVSIDAPKAYFLAKMAYPTAFIVDKHNVESKKDWWTQPNGTGPFLVKDFQRGKQITLERNSNFYREPARLTRINFQILSGNPMELYELNKIDVSPVSESYIEVARDPKGPFATELKVFPELSLTYIGFNVMKPPFDDVNVRKAFFHSVNKDKIIKIIMKDTVNKASGIIPPGMPGYSAFVEGYDFNIAKAKNLIAESKYRDLNNLPPIKITVSGLGGSIPGNLGALLQDWQNNLGVKVVVRQLEPEVFLYRIKEEVDEMYLLGWVADYPDPQDFLDNLFKTRFPYNTSKYSNLEVDTLLENAAIESDTTRRLAQYKQAEQIIMKDAPIIPLWNGTNYTLIKPHIKDYKLNAIGIPSFAKAHTEP